jgi:hypothetical protein
MLILSAATLVACGGESPAQNTPVPTNPPVENTPVPDTSGQNTAGQDAHITVQHILIGFKDAVGFQGSAPPKAAARTQEQARTLAYELLSKAKAGEDFDKLVAENTDDSPPGIYGMANNGVAPSGEEFPRNQLVPAFGDVGFALKMGEIGIADYDPQASPFGYHIIKRVAPPPTPTPETKPAGQDDRIQVQHILIGFKDAVGFQGRGAPPKAAIRTQEQARTLAYELLDRAKKGEDFDKLVTENTDDSPPGIYGMANNGVPTATANEFPRRGMVPAFGDVGFALKVGEIGIADYDPQKSPFGYHIIKRVK